MRYVIVGAGAIGSVLGAHLVRAGADVLLVARGAQYRALSRHGLRLLTPAEDLRLQVPVTADLCDAELTTDDRVILAVKSQDTVAAVNALADLAVDVPIFCAQNGVANERSAARRRFRTYGICVRVAATFVESGAVASHGDPVPGALDLGRYALGIDDLARSVADDLGSASFDVQTTADIMRWKYGKLLTNLANSAAALCGSAGTKSDVAVRALAEATRCLAAADINCAPAEEMQHRVKHIRIQASAQGYGHVGGSTWQSLHRGSGAVEVDWLNGEISLLGRVHGIATPANDFLGEACRRAARAGRTPGTWGIADLDAAFLRWSGKAHSCVAL